MVSADIQPKAVERVLSLGAAKMLPKPLKQEELVNVFLKMKNTKYSTIQLVEEILMRRKEKL